MFVTADSLRLEARLIFGEQEKNDQDRLFLAVLLAHKTPGKFLCLVS
jgi:hypothetical protein